MAKSDSLQVGDTLLLSEGYSFEPQWLAGTEQVQGQVISFIPGQNDTPAAIVQLDQALTSNAVTGDVVVLELRYVDAVWGVKGIVHVERCDFMPEPKPWKGRRQGKWVESHATYKRQAN